MNATALEGRLLPISPIWFGKSRRWLPRTAKLPNSCSRGRSGRRSCPGCWLPFLTVELVQSGWRTNYSPEQGLTLEHDGRTVIPQKVVSALRKGELSRESFLELVQ